MIALFPRIPVVENGMVLSATTLNAYHRGLRYLLGQAHMSRMYQTASNVWSSTTSTTYVSLFSGYVPLVGRTLYYNLWIKGTWDYAIQYYGDDSAWHTVVMDSGSGDEHHEDTVDLSGEGQLTDGVIYPWRVVLKTTAGNTGYVAVWALTIQPAISGWVAPTVFADAATSGEDDFNNLRTDLYALRDWQPGYGHLQTGTAAAHYVDTSLWHTFWKGTQRWKEGQSVYCSIEAKGWQGNGRKYVTWGVDLVYPVRDGDYWSVLNVYSHNITSDELATGAGQYVRFDTTIDTAEFGALVAGTVYGLAFWVYLGGSAEDGNDIWVRRPIAHRVADPDASAGWPTLTDWAHGDTDVGETRLNAMSTALGELYTGGGEHVLPEVPVHGGALGAMIHAKRWLVYYITTGASPNIRYGANNEGSYDLPTDVKDEYVSFDLTAISGLTPGALYILSGVTYAAEADEPYA